jgi:hypothetical protein
LGVVGSTGLAACTFFCLPSFLIRFFLATFFADSLRFLALLFATG